MIIIKNNLYLKGLNISLSLKVIMVLNFFRSHLTKNPNRGKLTERGKGHIKI